MGRLEHWLMEEGMLSQQQLQQARDAAAERGLSLPLALLELELLTEQALVELIARRHQLPEAPRRLYRCTVPQAALRAIAQDHCWQHGVFPFGIDLPANTLQVAMLDPGDPEAQALLRRLPKGLEADRYVTGPRRLEKAIRKHYLDSLVESTHVGGLRFFGYDNITSPGVKSPLAAAVASSAETPQPAALEPLTAHHEAAIAPEPALDDPLPVLTPVESPAAPTAAPTDGPAPGGAAVPVAAGDDPHGRTTRQVDPQRKMAIGAVALGRSKPAPQQLATLQRRVDRLERTVQQLLELLIREAGSRSAETARLLDKLDRPTP